MALPVRKKLIVVGDGGCGKTCLLTVFAKNEFPSDYLPTIFDTYVTDMIVEGTPIHFELNDTSGQEDYDRLRPLQYPNTDVILICFSVVEPDSLANILITWIHEIRKFCPNKPIILVGTKSDLRNDGKVLEELRRENQLPVTTYEAEQVAKKIGAIEYLECSALKKFNVKEIFYNAGKAALSPKARNNKGRPKRNKSLCILV